MLVIPGDYLEGGGQILRTATSLSCITGKAVRVFNIRAKRSSPGLKPQHLYTLKILAQLFRAQTQGIDLGSKEIIFKPTRDYIQENNIKVDLKTAGSIGLALQSLLLVSAFKSKGVTFDIKGGTCGLGAVPVDYYLWVVFPILLRSGLRANLEIIRHGYYPKGGGEVRVKIEKIKEPQGISLNEQGRLISLKGMSIASEVLASRQVAERQAKRAEEILKDKFKVPIKIETSYVSTFSIGSEINLLAYTENGCILWSDARGEQGKPAEKVGEEAAQKLIIEVDSQAAVDLHLADNLIPWLSLLGGTIKTSIISLHTQTNIWLCELFLGKLFAVEGTTISLVKPIDLGDL